MSGRILIGVTYIEYETVSGIHQLGELGYVDIFGNSLLLLGDDLAAVVTHRAAGTKTH